MTFAQRRNRLTTHFSERIPVVKRRMIVHCVKGWTEARIGLNAMTNRKIRVPAANYLQLSSKFADKVSLLAVFDQS